MIKPKQRDSAQIADLKVKRKKMVDQLIKNQERMQSQSQVGHMSTLTHNNQVMSPGIPASPKLRT